MVTFEGWTLPGVIGAGAAQTMMNLHGVRPGERVLMLGTGNVGLVVSYQLKQAGCDVVALVDAAPRVGPATACTRRKDRPHRRALLPLAHHQARRGHRPRDRRHHRPVDSHFSCPRHRGALRRRHHLRGRWPLALCPSSSRWTDFARSWTTARRAVRSPWWTTAARRASRASLPQATSRASRRRPRP